MFFEIGCNKGSSLSIQIQLVQGDSRLPQSRHRKIGKAKKRPRGMIANKGQGSPGANNDRRVKIIAIIVVAAVLLSAAGYLWTRSGSQGKEITTASGLKYMDIVEGSGPTPQKGQKVSVLYTGSLQNGTVFDSSAKTWWRAI